jgi:hypothetical protein
MTDLRESFERELWKHLRKVFQSGRWDESNYEDRFADPHLRELQVTTSYLATSMLGVAVLHRERMSLWGRIKWVLSGY